MSARPETADRTRSDRVRARLRLVGALVAALLVIAVAPAGAEARQPAPGKPRPTAVVRTSGCVPAGGTTRCPLVRPGPRGPRSRPVGLITYTTTATAAGGVSVGLTVPARVMTARGAATLRRVAVCASTSSLAGYLDRPARSCSRTGSLAPLVVDAAVSRSTLTFSFTLDSGSYVLVHLSGDVDLVAASDQVLAPAAPVAARAVAVATGSEHTCAVLDDGTARCWGRGSAGQLGDGLATDSATPVTVTGLTGATAIDAGGDFTCALLRDGTVSCWGGNYLGQLGDDSRTDRPTPAPVPGVAGATALAAGVNHACALLGDGSVTCWGSNAHGQLGNGAVDGPLDDTPHPPAVVPGLTALSLSARDENTCAVRSDHVAVCWGTNVSGQVGTGTYTDYRAGIPVPTPVAGLGLADRVGPSCAVLQDRTVWCWGGQGGFDPESDNIAPPPRSMRLSGIGRLGPDCAIDMAGTAHCWGYNLYGQLGNGSTTDSATPVTVTVVRAVSDLDRSDVHTCAVLTDGSVACWGANTWGQLGDGTTTNSLAAVRVTL